MATATKPLILMGSTPVYGHLFPVRAVAKGLVDNGYDVTFVSCSHYRSIFEDIGCTVVTLEGYADWYEAEFETRWPERNLLPPGPEQISFDVTNMFFKSIPGQFEALQRALKMLTEKHPGRPIIQIHEAVFQGALPINKGAKGLKPTATMALGVIPMTLSSIDTAPFGPGLLPPTTAEQRQQYQAMAEHIQDAFFGKPLKVWKEIILGLGVPEDAFSGFLMNSTYTWPDRFLQMCIPSVEYPRSDAPSTIRFAGGIPKVLQEPMKNPPSWWSDVTENKGKKDIIFVCQGTIALKYNELVIPTLEAFKDQENMLVVVALGKKGATLPEGTQVPANARVSDFIPYDDVLPYSSVFVTNGGYGSFQHGVFNGVPLVLAGSGEDKPEVMARAEWTGMGVNLRTGFPTSEQIKEGVEKTLKDPKYKIRAKELQAEMASYDPMAVVIKNIEELNAGAHLN